MRPLGTCAGRNRPLILCCGETSSFNASAIVAVQNARLTTQRNAGKPRGELGEAGVATLRARPTWPQLNKRIVFGISH
jgi:hypothetical protein